MNHMDVSRMLPIAVCVAGIGVVLNSLASTAIELPVVARVSGDRRLALRVSMALAAVIVLGLAATFVPVTSLVTVP